MADTLSLIETTTPSADDYLKVEGVTGSTNIQRRCKPSNLKVLDTGGSTTQSLGAWAADVTTAKANIVTLQVQALSTVGVVTTTATTAVAEYGAGTDHITVLTMTAFVTGTIVQSTNLAFGAKFYTLPAGTIQVERATWSGFLVNAGTTKTDTPEVGIGTVIASGASATLATTFENIMDGGATAGSTDADAVAIAPDVNSTVFSKCSLTTICPVIKVSGGASHDLFFNIADGWAGTSNGVLTATGVLTLKWRKIN